MKKFIKTFKYISILMLAISFIGCENDDDANLPELIAGFTYTLDADTGAVTFLNISENADDYSWDFGDGTSSTLINPVKVFPSGTYSVVLKASNAAGASGAFEDEVIINIPLPVNFPINFDDPNVNYDVNTFNGVSFDIVDNPDPSGSNTSTGKVGAITNIGAVFEGLSFDLGMPLDLTTLKSVKINFWSDTPIDVLMKLEQGTSGDVETSASHGGTGWELITFNFSSDASYSRITFFVDGPGTTAGTFYIDDVEQIETPAPTSGCNDVPVAATSLPLDFEGCETFPSGDNFGAGITSELTVNPSKTGINTSDFVLKVDKPTGSDFFAGIQNTFESNFDLTTTDVFKAKVYSTKAGVIFRFELLANPNDGSIGNPAPVFVTIPTADEWVEIEFTFTGLPAGPMAYNQLVIKPDNDQSDSAITNGGTYYLDDLTLNEDAGSGNNTILDFENNLAGVTTSEFETSGALVSNPASGGINTSANVYEATYTNGNQWWGGVGFVLDAGLDQATTVYKTKFYSTVAPTNVLFQVEVDGTNAPVGDVQTITTANEWVELTFTLANIPAGVNRILIRPDVGNQDGTKPNTGSLYIDDITEVGGSSGGDTVAPVITLNGDAVVNLTVGDSFTDPGAMASDDVDGDISGSIVVGGDAVDTNTEGTYVITYNVSDAAGNPATQVTRTVNVSASSNSALLDFENNLAGVTTSEFETSGALVSNPASGGINTSANVYEATYTNGNQWWGGVGFVLDAGLDQAATVYKTKFYSTVAPTNVLFQVEVDGTNAPVGDVQTITTANEWVELTFTLANIPAGVNRILIRPDVGNQDGTKPNTGSLYIDDITEVGGSSGGDTVAPVITLNGDAVVNLTVGDSFTDPGAMASDDVDGDISGSIVVGGDAVDTNTEGTYVITYNVSDAAGNPATQVTRTVNVSASSNSALLDFENNLAGVTTSEFETSGALVSNPASGGINTSANVYEATYTNGNQWWGGVGFVLDAGLDQATTVYKTKFYSTVAPTNVLFQVEVDGTNAPVGDVQTITTANEWVELTFTLANIPAGVNRILIRPDVGNQDGTKPNTGSLYIDDITEAGSGSSGGGTNPFVNGDFETGDDTGWLLFQNGGTAALDNTINNGGSWSGKLETGGPSNPAFKQERILNGTVAAGDVVQISFDHIGSVVQPGAVFNVLLFGEGAAGASFTHVFNPGPTLGGSWTTFTGTFTIPGGTDVSEGISFLIEAVCGGDAGCSVSANIDNVSIILNP